MREGGRNKKNSWREGGETEGEIEKGTEKKKLQGERKGRKGLDRGGREDGYQGGIAGEEPVHANELKSDSMGNFNLFT